MNKRLTVAVAAIALICLCTTCFFAGCNGDEGDYNYYEVPDADNVYAEGEEFAKGWSNDNNGYALAGETDAEGNVTKDGAEAQRLIDITPSPRQRNYMELEYYTFVHFGMNTFTGNEWGTGKENPKKFNPKKLDTDQWCEAVKASGSKGIMITAKHHDGFCLWQTETTEHSIKNSPYKDGKGDILAELSASCEKYGLKMGVYLSPWDMNAEVFGNNKYNDFYCEQLTELLDGRYGPDFNGDGKGEIFCVWMDGALGEDWPVEDDFYYDVERYEKLIHDLQPDCISANVGSEVRWVGNEAGSSRESEWNVVSRGNAANQNWQTSEDQQEELTSVNATAEDLGSRELLVKYQDLVWYPAEVDVSIRRGWFYHWDQSPKSLEHLLQIYYKAVGGNSSLLLNVTPNKKGLIPDEDVARLKEMGDAIAASVSKPMAVESISVGDGTDKNMTRLDATKVSKLLDESTYDGYTLSKENNEYVIEIKLDKPGQLGRIDLREDQRSSQRVEEFEVWVRNSETGKWQLIGDSTIIGNRRILMFENAPTTDTVRITIKQSRSNPVLRSISLYEKVATDTQE